MKVTASLIKCEKEYLVVVLSVEAVAVGAAAVEARAELQPVAELRPGLLPAPLMQQVKR